MVPAGFFTGVLTQCLAKADPQTLTYGHLINAVLAHIKGLRREQTPLLLGDPERPVFAPEEIYLRLFRFAQRRQYRSLTSEVLRERYMLLRRHVTVPFPQAYDSFGRAFLEQGDYHTAISALQTALNQRYGEHYETLLALGKAYVSTRRYAEALKSFQKCTELGPAKAALWQTLIARLEELAQGQKHALLVGVSKYANQEVAPVRDAVNDVLAFKQVLVTQCGFQAENVHRVVP